MPKLLPLSLLILMGTLGYGQANVPSLMVGQMPGSGIEGQPKNVFIGSFTATSVFDDNIQNLTSHHVPGGLYYFGSTVALQISRKHVTWDFDYQPAVMQASHGALDQFNQSFNQALGTTFVLRPDSRLSLTLRQEYQVTTDPFQHLGENAIEPQLGLLDRPNQSVVLPLLRQTALVSQAVASYRISRHTTVGVGGAYDNLRYGNVVANSPYNNLYDSKAATGSLFLSHQTSRRNSVGAQFRFSRFTVPGTADRTLAQALLLFDDIRFSEHHSLTLFAGPQHTSAKGQFFTVPMQPSGLSAVRQGTWSPAAGLVYTFSTRRNMFQASYVREVSDGAGVLPAVRLSSASISVGRQLTSVWTFNLGAGLAQNSGLDVAQTFKVRTVNGSVALVRTVRNNITLRLAYERLNQSGSSFYGLAGNHNRALCSIGYSFMKPLGK